MICPLSKRYCGYEDCRKTGTCRLSEEPPTRKETMEHEGRLIALLEDIAVSLHKIAAHQERRLALLEECNSMQSDDLRMRYEVNAALLGAVKKVEEEEPSK